MPTLQKQCTYEGGTNGATVATTDTGNGDSPTTVTATSAVVIYTTAWSAHGTKSCEISTSATSVQAFCLWTFTKQTTGNYEIYIQTPSSFALTPTIFRLRDGATQNIRGRWDSTGHLQLLNTSSSLIATTTDAMATSTAYRITISCTPGAGTTSGAAIVSFRPDIDGTTAPDAAKTLNVSGQNMGSTSGCSELGVGQFVALANLPAWRHDDPRMGFGGDLGPSAITLSPSAAAQSVLAADAAAALAIGPVAAASVASAATAAAAMAVAPAAAAQSAAAPNAAAAMTLAPLSAAQAAAAADASARIQLGALAAAQSALAVNAALQSATSGTLTPSAAGATYAAAAGAPALAARASPASSVAAAADATLQSTIAAATVQSVITVSGTIAQIVTAGQTGITTSGQAADIVTVGAAVGITTEASQSSIGVS